MAVVWSNAPAYGDIKDFGVSEAQASIACVKTGVIVYLQFKFSADGATWPTDASAVQIGTLDKVKPLSLIVKSSAELEIFDGLKVIFRSLKAGRAGTWDAL